MRAAVNRKQVPQWAVAALGRNVELVQPVVEDQRPGARGVLVMIDSGAADHVGKLRGSGPAWRAPTAPYAVVAFDPCDLSILDNVPFEALRPLG